MAYILALAVGLGSLALYLAFFFFPEVYRRKGDFVWSGLGLLYALTLWFCAGRITGAVLLGQMAAAPLLLWLGWEALTLRRQLIPQARQTPISEDVPQQLVDGLSQLPSLLKGETKEKSEAVPAVEGTSESEGEGAIAEQTVPPATETAETEKTETPSAKSPGGLSGLVGSLFKKKAPSAPLSPIAAEPPEMEAGDRSADAPDDLPAESATPEAEPLEDVGETKTATENAAAAAPSAEQTPPTPPSPAREEPTKPKSRTLSGFAALFSSLKDRFGKQPKTPPAPESLPEDESEMETVSDLPPAMPTPEVILPEVSTKETPAVEAPETESKTESETPESLAEPETSSTPAVTEESEAPIEPVAEADESPSLESNGSTDLEMSEQSDGTSPSQPVPSSDTEASAADGQPELIRPNPPDPKLVEAAQNKAETASEPTTDSSESAESLSETKKQET